MYKNAQVHPKLLRAGEINTLNRTYQVPYLATVSVASRRCRKDWWMIPTVQDRRTCNSATPSTTNPTRIGVGSHRVSAVTAQATAWPMTHKNAHARDVECPYTLTVHV